MKAEERQKKRKLEYFTSRLKVLDRKGPEDNSEKAKAAFLRKRERTIRKINRILA